MTAIRCKLTQQGNTCPICPVSSNTMTDVDIVLVTLPAKAAAPDQTNKTINRGQKK